MKKVFQPTIVEKWAVYYDERIARFEIFETEEAAYAFAENLQVDQAQKDYRWYEMKKNLGHEMSRGEFSSDIHIQKVITIAPSQAALFAYKHGNCFEELPLCEISQGWKIAEWGGGPIEFKAPTLPAGAWSHDPDEKGNFVIIFADGSFLDAQIQKP